MLKIHMLKSYLYAKDPYEAKCKLLVNKRENAGLKHLIDSKTFIEYLNDMDDIYKNIEEYNPNKKRKIFFAFNDMITDMLSNKKPNPIVSGLFIRSRMLNVFLVFITQSYFAVPKNILKVIHTILLWKFRTKENFNKSHLIIYKTISKPYSFLVIDTTLAPGNPLPFWNNLLEKNVKITMIIIEKIKDEKF